MLRLYPAKNRTRGNISFNPDYSRPSRLFSPLYLHLGPQDDRPAVLLSLARGRAGGSLALLADASPPGLAPAGASLSGRDQTGELPGLPDHARHADGLLCSLHRAAERLWRVLSSVAAWIF